MATFSTDPETLHGILAVPRWVDEVQAAGPYASVDELVSTAEAAAELSEAEIDQALSGHPRIGEKHEGTGVAATFSAREQGSAADSDDAAINARIAEGNVAYEQRFGRVFLIRAAGRSRAEVLAELNRRLDASDAEELVTVAQQLREITVLRLRQAYADAVV